MLPVLTQTLWCWGLLAGVSLLLVTLIPTARQSFTGWHQKGIWSCGFYLLFITLCTTGYLIINLSALYVYNQPTGSLMVTPPGNAPGEVQLLAYATFLPATLTEGLRPLIPLGLVGLTAFIALLFAISFAKSKVAKEQKQV